MPAISGEYSFETCVAQSIDAGPKSITHIPACRANVTVTNEGSIVAPMGMKRDAIHLAPGEIDRLVREKAAKLLRPA